MSDTESSFQYLLACSEASLESFELSRLNRASNLRKELSQVAEEWVDAEVSSRLARLIVERRRADLCPPEPQLKQSTIVTSRGQSTLCLPFSCEPADASTETKPVELSLKPPNKRAKDDKPASARSNEKTTGNERKNCVGSKEVRRGRKSAECLKRQNNLFAAPFRPFNATVSPSASRNQCRLRPH